VLIVREVAFGLVSRSLLYLSAGTHIIRQWVESFPPVEGRVHSMGVGLLFFLLSAVAFFLLHAVSQICKRRNGIGLLGLLGLLFGIRITFVLWRHFFSPHFHFVFFSVAYSGVPVVILGILYSQPAAGARVCFWFFIFSLRREAKKAVCT